MNPGIFQQFFGSRSEIVLVVAMLGILLVLFTPIPSGLLDFLLLVNVSFGMLILLLTFFMDKPLTFSTFPSLLLMATLFRLSLNIAATRLILSDADAGEVIAAIGNYVVGGNYVIGMVVFFILIVVQYVVVTNGAQRVAEVAARFTLDSMPGKQMSIDADLNMGLIDEHEAQDRRKNIEREANFYGSMDGASKFVKGDAIAGIIIILIDIIGGLTVGIAQKGMAWGDALQTYTLLTVGDGIVTQIPALVISTATGIIVTRAATDAHLSEEITSQITRYPKSLVMLALALSGLILMPGIPVAPVVVILIVVLVGAYFAYRQNNAPEEVDEELINESVDDQNLYEEINVEPIELAVGSALVPAIGEQDGLFMEKIKAFRKQYAMDMGFVFPSVRLMDDNKIEKTAYRISVYDARVARGEIFPDKLLAISASARTEKLQGIETEDPSYGLPSIWIDPGQSTEARASGYTVVDPVTVMFTHFSEIIRRHAPEMLTRVETEQVVKRVKDTQASLYEELVPNVLSLSEIQKVLQILLAEKVSIRNIASILETLADAGKRTKDPRELAEAVRQNLGRSICEGLLDAEGALRVLTFDPAIEHVLQSGLRSGDSGISLLVDPRTSEQIITELGRFCEQMMLENLQPVLICSSTLRRHVKKLLDRVLPHLSVLALTEIPGSINISSFGVVKIDQNTIQRDRLSRAAQRPDDADDKANAPVSGVPANA